MNNSKFLIALLFTCLSALQLSAQQQSYKVSLIGFYNLENLFDTINTPDVRDEEFTPTGKNLYTPEVYKDKLGNLSKVISEMGTDLSPDGMALLGVSEIENRSVLEDLVKQPKIADRNYQIIHYDSPDKRGIDVGLLYNPKYFTPSNSKNIPLMIYEQDDSTRIFTRDILMVEGQMDGETITVFVNHWPSRRGGEARSAPLRNAGAMVCKTMSDSIRQVRPDAKILIMGDLNDNPTSPSVAEVLAAKGKKKQVKKDGWFNPMWSFYRQGQGSNAWRDAWSLFDQIIMSHELIEQDTDGYFLYKTVIFNPAYMVQKTGHFKGYPFRTYAGGAYMGGYSDHFPVYVALVKAQ